MELYLEEIKNPDTEESTYELQDGDGNTVVNLSEIMDDNLHEVEEYDEYISGRTFDWNEHECFVLFNKKGKIIISPILEYTYIPERNEFIVFVNRNHNEECQNETYKEDSYYGLIDFSGNFIIPPKYSSIKYDKEVDIYLVDEESYYKDGHYIGVDCSNGNNDYLIFKRNNKFGVVAKDGIILDANYTIIEEIFDNTYLLSDGKKYGLYDIASSSIPELIYDGISESFVIEFMGQEYYLVKTEKKYGLADKNMQLLFINLLDGIDENSFTNHSYVDQQGNSINYTTFIAFEDGKYWNCEMTDEILISKQCTLSGSGAFPMGFDYLNKLIFSELNNKNEATDIENTFIQVGYGNWNKQLKYQLLVCLKNKFFEQDDFRICKLGQNEEILITYIEENYCGAIVLNKSYIINQSRDYIAIPFRYKELNPIKSKYSLIIGFIGQTEDNYDIYEPMQFIKIGQTGSYEEGIILLKQYYSDFKK